MPGLLSSIFNFESLRTIRPRWPRTVIVAAAAIIVATVVFQSNSSHWIDAVGPEARLNAALDDATRRALPNARIVVIGSSRPAFGIQARTLARALGYGADKGVNLAYPTLHGEILLELYGRAEPLMPRDAMVVIGIDEYFLARWTNEPPRPPVIAPALRPHGSSAPSRDASTRDWHLHAIGTAIPEGFRWLNYEIARRIGIPVVRAGLDTWYRSREGSLLSLGDEDYVLETPNGQAIAEGYFKGKVVDTSLLLPYREIISRARSRGNDVALIMLPSHPVFTKAAQKSYGPMVEETIAAFVSLAREQGVTFHAFDAASCNLHFSDFRDEVHLTPRGAATFTLCLADYLRARGPL